MFQHGEDGEDVTNSICVGWKASGVEFEGWFSASSEFLDELGHQHFERFTGPHTVIFSGDR
jgi:hypothetical protein